MAGEIVVRGLPELGAAFARMDAGTKKAVRAEIKSAAQPVATKAEGLAVAEISNIGDRWSRMRVGSKGGMLAYVAPKARRRGGSPRPNLAPLLKRSMDEALDNSRGEVEQRIETAVDAVLATF
jgi:hypothetical protein